MTSLPSRFPRRVRIHGGGFDASARAMHREAALENVSRATIERKTMSTKTTLKRISLVAVAAMGFGLLSVVPSSATPQSDTLTLSAATSSVTVGTAASITVTQTFIGSGVSSDTMTVTTSLVSSPSGNATLPTLTAVPASSTGGTVSASGLVGTMSDTATPSTGLATGVWTATLPSTVIAGTYVIKFTPSTSTTSAVLGNAAAQTWTVTVGAEGPATAAQSTWGMSSGISTPTQGTHTAISVAKTLPAAQVATIKVVPLKADGTAPANIKLSATISGPGTLGVNTTSTTSSTGRAITSATAGDYFFGVFNDGTSGVATITITEPGGAVLATATVNFADTLASYTLTPTNTVTKVGGTDVVTIAGKDAAGVTASVGTYYVSSSNTAVATVTTTGQTGSTFNVTGAAAGTAVITVANALTSPTITKTYTVTVGKATIGTVTMTTDKTSYAAGEKVTVTVTAKGSDGTAVGDATLTAFSATVVSNVAVQGTLPTSSIAFVGGVKTFVIYAPLNAGTVTLTGTEGASTDTVIADSTAGKTITASFDVTNPSNDAAVDAANAATDAANYAADAADAATTAAQEATAAAQAAQDSADAATAAVVALGLRVDTLMASVRAQLTSLSNLLVRIIKKTKA